jgi:sec-independent protein translocase protein TatB
MFDIGWSELVLIAVVALIVIGPKELPGVLRMVGQWTAKVRRMAAEFQGQFNEALREAEMVDLKKQVDEINETARSIAHFDPLAEQPSKPAAEPSKPVETIDAGESALVDAAASQPALPAVNDAAAAGATPAEALPSDAGGTEYSAEPAAPEPTQPVESEPTPPVESEPTPPVESEATSPVAPANAGAPSTEPRPAP